MSRAYARLVCFYSFGLISRKGGIYTAMAIPREFINELVARTDIVDLIDAKVPLKKAGKNHSACCPFHSEKSPSFTVSRDKQFYHCFGCGAHGNAIDFVMEYDRLDFVDAIEELAGRLEIGRAHV